MSDGQPPILYDSNSDPASQLLLPPKSILSNSLKITTSNMPDDTSMPVSPVPSQIPSESHFSSSIDDFEIRAPIGFGSSAVVYSAVYKPKNKQVAIKKINLDFFERNQIDELRRETALMALSKHPNVLRVYGSFVHDSDLYIVTPYSAGGSCLDIMKTGYPDGFEETSIATILKQALEGLAYLHKNGHIHRDVKAGNLLMDEDGTVLLADFGVSSSFMETGERGLRKTFVGTPCWMAPEVMEQAGYDYKADIWSFGITAIELATGHAPFAKLPPLKVLMMTLSNDPPTLVRETTTHKYSRVFKDMIDLCLNKDPSKRPNAEKLLQNPFFKQARKPDYLVRQIIKDLLPLEERQRTRIPTHRTAVEHHEENKEEEEWDFTGDESQPPQIKQHVSFGDVVVRNPVQLSRTHSTSSHFTDSNVSGTPPRDYRLTQESYPEDTQRKLFRHPSQQSDSDERKSRFEVHHGDQTPLSTDSNVALTRENSALSHQDRRKVGRFELTQASSDSRQDESTYSSSSTSPSSFGRALPLKTTTDVQSQLEDLIRWNESQRILLQELYGIFKSRKQTTLADNTDALHHQLEAVAKENIIIQKENDELRREIELLRQNHSPSL